MEQKEIDEMEIWNVGKKEYFLGYTIVVPKDFTLFIVSMKNGKDVYGNFIIPYPDNFSLVNLYDRKTKTVKYSEIKSIRTVD